MGPLLGSTNIDPIPLPRVHELSLLAMISFLLPNDYPFRYGIRNNVRGEPVFSVMAAGWICEKSG